MKQRKHGRKAEQHEEIEEAKKPTPPDAIPCDDSLTNRELQQVNRLCRKSRLLAALTMDSIQLRKMNGDLCKGYRYLSDQEFVLKHGRLFQPQPFPEKYLQQLGRKKECLYNALLLASSSDLNYAEGFVMPATETLSPTPMIMPHAWCVDAVGNVVDPTLYDMMGAEYCGLLFQKEPLLQLLCEGKPFGFLFNGELFDKICSGEVTDFRKYLLE